MTWSRVMSYDSFTYFEFGYAFAYFVDGTGTFMTEYYGLAFFIPR